MKAIWSIIFKDVLVEFRNKETLSAMIMQPVLQIPLTIPVVICAVEATAGLLIPDYGENSSWLSILAGFTIVYLAVSYLLFEFAVED